MPRSEAFLKMACADLTGSQSPATQKAGGCRQVPHLPRKRKVDVAKHHACHAKCHSVTGDQRGPSVPPDPAQCHKCHACHAKCGCRLGPNATFHAKGRSMSPRAAPATQTGAASRANQTQPSAISATLATQKARGCRQAPRLPRKGGRSMPSSGTQGTNGDQARHHQSCSHITWVKYCYKRNSMG